MIITLAIVGLLVGVVGVAIGRLSGEAERSAAMRGTVGALVSARIEAMRTNSSRSATLRITPDGVVVQELEGEKRVRSFRARGLRLVDQLGRDVSETRATFDAAGRTRERLWRVEDRGSATPSGRVGERDAGRIWRIEFDPISGAPGLRTPGEFAADTRAANSTSRSLETPK